MAFFLFAAASATFTGWSWRLPQVVYRLHVSRHLSAFLTGMLAGGFFFAQGFLSPLLRQAGWMGLVLAIGVWLVFLLTNGSPGRLRPVLILVAAMTVVTGFRNLSFQDPGGEIPWLRS